MSDLVVAAVVLGVLYLACKRTDPMQVPTVAPPLAVPTAQPIGGPIRVGASYAVPPWSTILASPGASAAAGPVNSVNYPTGQPPPQPQIGGIASGAGPQGVALGGPITSGVSTGTGTSNVVGLTGYAAQWRKRNPTGTIVIA